MSFVENEIKPIESRRDFAVAYRNISYTVTSVCY